MMSLKDWWQRVHKKAGQKLDKYQTAGLISNRANLLGPQTGDERVSEGSHSQGVGAQPAIEAGSDETNQFVIAAQELRDGVLPLKAVRNQD